LRALAVDYEVAHTTLLRHFRRPDAVRELRDAGRRLRAERNARHAEERRLKQEVQKRAQEDETRDRRLKAWPPPGAPRRSGYLGWLDERDGPRGLASYQRYNANAEKAAEVAASGGGIEQVIEATGLTRDHILRRMDAQIVRRLLAHERKSRARARLDVDRLRRLVPDYDLIDRRAAGEPLRSIATDYHVSHTTLSRYYRRPKVAKQLHAQQRRRRPGPASA
jgi:DNA invertase Pin-like site-specific DNA recombinase